MQSKLQRKCCAVAGLIVLAAFVGCAITPKAVAQSQTATPKKLSFSSAQQIQVSEGPTFLHDGAQIILTQTTVPPSSSDATSGATQESKDQETSEGSEAVSSASVVEESAVKDATYCLKCHGPFEKLAEKTKDYVTEFDEKVNPHRYVPHNSTSIVDCTECHQPHPIPFKATDDMPKPNVDYCYSCHHTQTFATCSECHNE